MQLTAESVEYHAHSDAPLKQPEPWGDGWRKD
jgi:ABC-2 type transport system ATP-binding protein